MSHCKCCRGEGCCARCCSRYCTCNSACCFGFRIPLPLGIFFNGFWIIFNGFSLPFMSYVFWPKPYIFYPLCIIGTFVVATGILSMINLIYKNCMVFRIVINGLFAAYMLVIIIVLLGVNIDIDTSKELLIESFLKNFKVQLWEKQMMQMLQTTQIVYDAYLLLSYTYCGFVIQIYKHKFCWGKEKRRRIKWEDEEEKKKKKAERVKKIEKV